MKLLIGCLSAFLLMQWSGSLAVANENLYKEVQWVQKKISRYKTIGQWVEKSSAKIKTKRRLLYGKLYDVKIPPMMAHKNQIFIFNKIGHLPDVLEVKIAKGQRQYYYNEQNITPQKNESEKQWLFRNYPHLKPRRYSVSQILQEHLIPKSWAIGLRGQVPKNVIPISSEFFDGVDFETNPHLLALKYGADFDVQFFKKEYKLECVSSKSNKKLFEARYDINGQVIPIPLDTIEIPSSKIKEEKTGVLAWISEKKDQFKKFMLSLNDKCNEPEFRKKLSQSSEGSSQKPTQQRRVVD